MVSSSKVFLLLCAGVVLGACEEQPATEANAPADDQPVAVVPAEVTPDLQLAKASTSLGDPLPRLSATDLQKFTAGQAVFTEVEEPDDGLGPVFNEASCATCHTAPVGGTAGRLETRFGRTAGGVFDPMASVGGSLMQDHAIGAVADGFTYVAEQVPSTANVVAGRMTTPLFGLGLVEAVPDAELIGLARLEKLLTRTGGTPGMVKDIGTGKMRVGRFGWKAQVATLHTFSGDAYLNEMGVTSPDFPDENCPQGDCAQLVHNPVPGLNDDGDDVEAFADFMRLLAPPPQGSGKTPAGAVLFQFTGCAACHTPRLATGPSPIAALDRKVFEPFSDFLLHDMGKLGDGIVQGAADGRQMRTAPLWGLHTRPVFLHDGRATSVEAAILAHDGQGGNARDRYAGLSSEKKRALLAYLNSL
jgi:CxxC motif-containing protein (DUF1111 family)